jgi:hypothetical protein
MQYSESPVLIYRVAEKSPSHNPIYMCICMCNLYDLATLWNPKLVHGNTVSVAQTCRVELQRVTGLNQKLYCVTLTNRQTLHLINNMTQWLLPMRLINNMTQWLLPNTFLTWHQAERFSSHSECTICHNTHDRSVNFGLRKIYVSQ